MNGKKTITNGDRIRAMTDEAMVKSVLGQSCPPGCCKCHLTCRNCWLYWLKAPVEDAE